MIKKYINCVSLGWFCGTASSLSKLGLRSWSGPFDWYYSHFESVLDCINTDFSDFMKAENLYESEEDEKIFLCKRYGFRCNHDIQNTFSVEIEGICQKYLRRARRFIEETKQPTLFFRTVRDMEEIDYIVNNIDYILSVIKKNNSSNDICFVLLEDLPDLPNSLKWFKLPAKKFIGKILEMRNLFELSPELKKYALSALDNEQIITNIKYDFLTNRNRVCTKICNYLIEKNSPIILNKIKDKIDIKEDSDVYVFGGDARFAFDEIS